MEKHTLSLLVLTLIILPGLSLGETTSIQQPKAFFETGQIIELKEVESGTLAPVPKTDVAPPRVNVSEPLPDDIQSTIKLEMRSVNMPVPEKCGVNTFSLSNQCGIGVFKSIYFQCYDNYEQKEGGEGSCKSSDVWKKYAESICLKRCSSSFGEFVPVGLEIMSITGELRPIVEAREAKPITVCYASEQLMRDYSQLMLQLEKTRATGNENEVKDIENKIFNLKQQIEKSKGECVTTEQQTESALPPTQEITVPREPVVIDRCKDVVRMQEKLAYYENLRNLSDTQVIEETSFSREQLGIDDVIKEISVSMEKMRAQCRVQGETLRPTAVTTIEKLSSAMSEPINPVVVESGQEIDNYYQAKIERITSVSNIDEQIQDLKTLKGEIDVLIKRLINTRKEIEVGELDNVVTEIKMSKGEIKADDIIIKTTDKKMFMNVGESPVSIEPTEKEVLIKDGSLDVTAEEISIKENVMSVGAVEVRLSASYIAEKLQVSPKSVELKEEGQKAVYKMKIDEPRKLFGFIPFTVQKTMTTDADNGDVLKEQRPWYAFLSTK